MGAAAAKFSNHYQIPKPATVERRKLSENDKSSHLRSKSSDLTSSVDEMLTKTHEFPSKKTTS